ncbi:MAG: cation transporter [Patescibacteria group bacterium]
MEANPLLRKGLFLEYLTLGWNVVGSVIAVWAGIQASSLAIFGFGIDSVIEIFASVVVVWQLKAINTDNERFALKLIGAAFMALSLYLLVRAVSTLVHHVHPQASTLGALWLLITAIAMFLLAHGKRRVGKQLGNTVLQEEAIVTAVDGLLAAALLLGVLLDMYLGWWWADPLASLVLVYIGGREAIHIFVGSHSH